MEQSPEVRKWESLGEVILRTYSLVGLRADVDLAGRLRHTEASL